VKRLPKLRTTAKAPDELSPDEIVETLLAETGAMGKLPTNEQKLLSFLQLKQLSFDFAEEFDFLPEKEELPNDLRAVLSVEDKIVATHAGLGIKRTRFSVLHEIGHYILPDHRQKLFPDTAETLSWWTRSRLEKEANQVAADLLFQANRFTEEAVSLPLSSRTAHDLAPKYGASYEATIRRYVERHVLPCAVIVYDKVSQGSDEVDPEDDQYRIQYTIPSPAFSKRCFSRVKSDEEFSRGSEIFRVHGARDVGDILQTELVVERNDGPAWHFETEIFTNGYKIFQLLTREIKSKQG